MTHINLNTVDALKAGVSVLALAGTLALAQPAFADTQYGPVKPSFELAYNDDHSSEEKEESHENYEENDSEVEQDSAEESGQADEVDEEDEASADEEEHTNAASGWWNSVTDWFSDFRS